MSDISTTALYAVVEGDPQLAARPGFFRRVMAGIIEAQQRRADREVRRILARYADVPPHVLKAERALEYRSYPLGR